VGSLGKRTYKNEERWVDVVCCLSLWLASFSLMAAATVLDVNRPFFIIMLSLTTCAIGETVTLVRKKR
jgi:hypothetical protein